MSSIDDTQELQSDVDDELCEPDAASHFGRVNLRAFLDVVFGGAALALLLAWLVLVIAGGRLA